MSQFSVFSDFLDCVNFLKLCALLPFFLKLVLVKDKIVEIFYDKEGFLLEILFGLKVEFFSLFLIIA